MMNANDMALTPFACMKEKSTGIANIKRIPQYVVPT
jgi:hypothetical protein